MTGIDPDLKVVGHSNTFDQAKALAARRTHPSPAFFILLLILLLFVLIRIGHLPIPFERDEGAYSYYGQLILDGEIPYVSFYEMKPPGLFYAYALVILIFGDTVEGVHAGFLVINVLTLVCVFVLGRRLLGDLGGLLSAASFGLLSSGAEVCGFTAQAEHLVVLFSTAGLVFVSRAQKTEWGLSLFAGGVSLGIACLIKQTGALFVLLGGILVLARGIPCRSVAPRNMFRALLAYGSGVLLMLAAAYVAMLRMGVFEEFLFWAYKYPRAYATEIRVSEGMILFQRTLRYVTENYEPLWLLSSAGLVLTPFLKVAVRVKVFIYLFSVASFLTLFSGLRFYGHYWLQVCPAAALLAGTALCTVRQLLTRLLGRAGSAAVTCGILVALIASILHSEREYYFKPDANEILRRVYEMNPFPEAKVIGDFIRERSNNEEDRIALLGSEPEIYFYAGRKAASRHAYFSYLVSNHPYHGRWQKEFMQDVERNRPKFLVLISSQPSLLVHLDAEIGIFSWVAALVKQHYELIGYADMKEGRPTVYAFDDQVDELTPGGRDFIAVYQRK